MAGRHLLAAAALCVAACATRGIGERCLPVGDGGAIGGTVIRGDALECLSRICLAQPQSGAQRDTCTDQCQSDDDCANAVAGHGADGLCEGRFVCAVPEIVGFWKCLRLCVCRADLVCGMNSDADGGATTPLSCGGTSSPSCP